jgi:hypothetical protein
MIPQGIQTQATNAGAWIDTSSDLVKQIKKLEHDSEALGRVRATLVVNYGPSRATDGIVIKDHRSELSMLVDILQEYHNRIDVFTKWLEAELNDGTCPEFLAAIRKVQDRFLSLKVNAE